MKMHIYIKNYVLTNILLLVNTASLLSCKDDVQSMIL